VLLDIDNFKLLKDGFGHSAGDDLLLQVSDILKDCSRDQDLVMCFGDEVFLLALLSTSLESAQTLVDRIGSAIKAKTSINFSGGIAMHSEQLSLEQLKEKADQCLYTARHEGKDRFVLPNPDKPILIICSSIGRIVSRFRPFQYRIPPYIEQSETTDSICTRKLLYRAGWVFAFPCGQPAQL
jgi:diguanylate cyclase (GGDEF)-like protein